MEDMIWVGNCIGLLAHVLEALGSPVVPALGNGASIFRHIMGARSSGTAAAGNATRKSADPYRLLNNLLTIIRAQNKGSATPYRMQRDDEVRMKDLFCMSGHLMRAEFELYTEFLGVCPRTDADYNKRSSILEKMHKSVESRHAEPNG